MPPCAYCPGDGVALHLGGGFLCLHGGIAECPLLGQGLLLSRSCLATWPPSKSVDRFFFPLVLSYSCCCHLLICSLVYNPARRALCPWSTFVGVSPPGLRRQHRLTAAVWFPFWKAELRAGGQTQPCLSRQGPDGHLTAWQIL